MEGMNLENHISNRFGTAIFLSPLTHWLIGVFRANNIGMTMVTYDMTVETEPHLDTYT